MDTREIRPFGELLRSYRLAAGLSQERLAERASLSMRGISDLERGARTAPRLETVRMLADGLELPPEERAALLRAARAIEKAAPSGRDAEPPSLRLPLPPTQLVGRERDFESVMGLLRTGESRLITLTGPGGVGKTRLAQEVALSLEGSFPDGACFVSLVAIPSATLVMPTIANALGLRNTTAEPLQATLERHIANKHMLLVLDNFEHVLDASPSIASLLSASAGLKVLATSRMPLQLRGERLIDLAPLEVPDTELSMSRASPGEYSAVQLFLARIQDVKPGFALDGDNAESIVEICRRLDGLPLALELAAVRIKLLTPQALLQRLERRLPLLTGGPRDLPERQQTMRATISWGYDLLSPREQVLFRRLGVFLGGWTLEAAEAVASEEGSPDIVEGLASLVDASLVQVSRGRDGNPRYQMLETVREFALDELEASGEAEVVGRKHATYFLALVEADKHVASDASQRRRDAQMAIEVGNIRVALAWLRDHGMNREGVRLVTTMGGFWSSQVAKLEGRAWLSAFLGPAMDNELPERERIAGLWWLGLFGGPEDDRTTVVMKLRECLFIARREHDNHGVYSALHAIGQTLLFSGNPTGSTPYIEEAISLTRKAGDRRATASCLADLAYAVGSQGEVQRAERLATEALALARAYRAPRGFEATSATLAKGWVALIAEDDERAEQLFKFGLDLSQEIGHRALQGEAFQGLAEVALSRGQIDQAAIFFLEGLARGRESDFSTCLVANLQGLVRVATQRGDLIRAARLAGGVERFGSVIRAMPVTIIQHYEEDVIHLRRALGDETFSAERDLGKSLDTRGIVAEALAEDEELPASPDGQCGG
jgi:predicted ATPase/DNA-binding XRE family transcriptional regulator